MKESKLSPFDGDLLAMIADITKVEPKVTENDDRFVVYVQPELTIPGETMEALGKAVAGRLGDRLLGTSENHGVYSFYISYDPEEYPEEMRTRLVGPDATAGTRYCRTLLEVDAIQFRRDNVDDVLRFTGGGTVVTPRTPDGKAIFSFPNGNGIFVDVPESWYIIRELNGRFTARPEKDFKREFEPKGTPGTNAGQRINGKEGDAMKNKCSSEIPNMPTECAPDNRRPEKICGTCRYFNPEFPVNGKPAPVCLAIKEMKGGTEYSNPRGTQHYFRCSNGRYENGIGQ